MEDHLQIKGKTSFKAVILVTINRHTILHGTYFLSLRALTICFRVLCSGLSITIQHISISVHFRATSETPFSWSFAGGQNWAIKIQQSIQK